MLKRQNPLSIEAVGKIQIDVEGQVGLLSKKIEDADNSLSKWRDDQVKLLKQRFGIRKPKTVPWKGCANESWPLIDPVIRRWKPGIANLVLRAEPVCLFEALSEQSVESSRSAQEYYHWLFSSHMDRTPLTVLELVDSIAQFGKGYTRQGWDYQTERHSRVARVDSLFPEGIEQALQRANQLIAQQNQQLPEDQRQPALDVGTFLTMVLAQEYGLSPDFPGEAEMLAQAVGNILQGARYVRLVYQSVVSDKPAWRALSPLDVVRPPRSEAIEEDEFIAVTHRMSIDDIARRVRDGYFDANAADQVANRMSKHSLMDDSGIAGISRRNLLDVLNTSEGLSDTFDEHIPTTEVREIYAKIDIDGDGIAERTVLWYHLPTKQLLSAFEYPYPFREWPIVEFNFEHKDRRPYSARGIPKLLSTHQRLANTLHNSRLDAIQITTAPMFKVRSIGQSFSRNVKFRPGARIPVNDKDDIEPIVMDLRPILELLREEQLTRTLAEQYVGIFDPSLTQLQGAGKERRTATEVDAVVAQASETQSQDAQLFQLSMANVHRQIWDLWEEFGEEKTYYRVTGSEQPKLATKSEISGDYDIVPSGSPISTNRALILNRAREMVQLFMADPTMIVDKHELYKEYFQSHDFQLSQRLVRGREEVEVLQQAMQAVQKVQEGE